MWLPLGQIVGIAGLLLVLRSPRTGRDWAGFTALNVWCLLAAMLCGLRLWEVTIAFVLNVGIRWGVLFAWVYAVAGFPLVVWMISRSRPGQRFARRAVRLWFGTTLMLVVAEPLAWWLQQSSEAIALPESLPDAPAGQLRIVALGSSTMAGHPFEPKFGIPQMLAWRVQEMYPERQVVLENLAVPGQSVREAIQCLQRLTLRPHLVVLYGGHNEFLHEMEECMNTGSGPYDFADSVLVNSPLIRWLHFQLTRLHVMRMRFTARFALIDRHVVPPMQAPLRLRKFEQALSQLARYGQRQSIPMLWYVPAASESGFEPSRSWVRSGTSAADEQELTQLWETIRELMRQEDWTSAAERCREGLAQQPQFAEFHFRLGECLLRMGQPQEAQRHFAQAKDYDGNPVRLPHDYQQVVQAVADRFGIATVNGESALRPFTPQGILDRSVIYDNVHPTFRGFFLLGRAGANAVFQKKLLAAKFGEPQAISQVAQSDAARHFEIQAADVAVAQRRISNGLRWLSLLRFDAKGRMQAADDWEELSRMIESGEAQPGERGIEPLNGD
jgi:tetratricopeptide (TPR) repeat protein